MPNNSLFISYFDLGNFADNTTTYCTVNGCVQTISTEAPAQAPMRQNGTISNLSTVVSANTTTVSNVITVRNNLAATAMTVTYTSLQTGVKNDTTNTASIINTDEVDFEVAMANDASGAKTMSIKVMEIQFTSSEDNYIGYLTVGATSTSTTITTASTSYYLDGGTVYDSSTTEYPIEMLNSYTLSNLFTYTVSNARTTTTTITFRKNLANGNQTVNYTSGQTGVKEDTSNSDSIVSGDDIGYVCVTGTGTGTIALTNVVSKMVTQSETCFEMSCAIGVGRGVTGTWYSALNGTFPSALTTQSTSRSKAPFYTDLTNLRTYVSANTATGASTITVNVETVNTALSISYAVSETGLKRDTDVVNVTSGDNFGFEFVRGTSGTITIHFAAVTAYDHRVPAVSVISIING